MNDYADADALIDDPRVLALPIIETDDPLIDLAEVPGLAIDRERAGVQRLSDNPFQLRSDVVRRLSVAQSHLPSGYQLQVKEGWRPIWVQERLWQDTVRELRDKQLDLGEEELRREAAKFTAPPDVAPPHSTGGAVDLVLLQHGEAADMGWGFNQPGEGSRTAHPVALSARRNRELLAYAMESAGFINYPAEWWHWSHGDRYWAFQTRRDAALYGPLANDDHDS